MPFSVVKAMLDSKTPEAFLDLVLQAVKNNEWRYEAKLTQQDIDLLKREESKYPNAKRYNGITFQSRERSEKGKPNLIYFEINRRYSRKPQEAENLKENVTRPRINLFQRMFIPLDEDWNAAASVFGMRRAEHASAQPGTSTFSETLLIPVSAITHWRPFSKLKPFDKRLLTGGSGNANPNVHVFVDETKFRELDKYNRATETVFDYLKTLDFLSGNISENSYAKTMRFEKRRGKALGASPLEAFLTLTSNNYGAFFKEIAELTANKNLGEAKEAEASELKNAVERAVAQHLKLEECEFRKSLSTQLLNGLRHKGNRQSASNLVNEIRVLKHKRPRFAPRRWR